MKKIAVICWWNSAEKEISIRSWKTWFNNVDSKLFKKDFFIFPDNYNKFIKDYKKYDLIIPVFHGVWWEDWEIFAFLKTLWKKYLYSDFETHCILMNKFFTNMFVKNLWYQVPKSFLVQKLQDFDNIKLLWKVVVKPNRWGSSVDTDIFDNLNKAKKLVKKILSYDDVIIQQAIKWRELTVSLFGDYDKEIRMAWIIEIKTKRKFFDLKAKYDMKYTQELCPAPIDKKLEEKLEQISLDLYYRFKIKTLSRIDFIHSQEDWKNYFLEINTIPWFTPVSLLPQSVLYYWFKSIQEFITYCISQVI